MKAAGIVWDDKTLDEWIEDPAHFIPGNTMTFPGIKEAQPRADLLAFLKEATKPGATRAQSAQQGQGGMMGYGAAAPCRILRRSIRKTVCRPLPIVATPTR